MADEPNHELDDLKATLAEAVEAKLRAESALKVALDAGAALDSARERLARDHRVWARAWPAVTPHIRPQGNPLESDHPSQHVELLARAALTDSIAAVCDGSAAGLERAVLGQLQAILGDPELATVKGAIMKLRAQDSDEQMPASVTAVTRGAVDTLARIAESLPDGDCRRLIAAIINAQVAPGPGVADLLYRKLRQQEKASEEVATDALSAAQAIRTAFVGVEDPTAAKFVAKI